MDTISLHDPEPYEGYEIHQRYAKMSVLKCDITKLECDCIVNAANPSLLGGGGVDGAIHRAAGPLLREECRKLGGCKTGEAKITKGYNLPAKYVIHTVGPIYSQMEENYARAMLWICYCACLNVARDNDIHSIAFPAISTGAYGYPIDKAAWAAVHSVDYWLQKNPNYDIQIIFACYDEHTAEQHNIWVECGRNCI